MAKIVINQDKIDNIEEVLQICPFEAMEEVDGKVEINAPFGPFLTHILHILHAAFISTFPSTSSIASNGHIV